MNEILVDTNVFIYALDKKSIYNQQTIKLLNSPNNTLFTSTKNISQLFSIVSKLNLNNDAFNRFYTDLKRNIEILFPTNESLAIFEKLYLKYNPIGNRVFDIEIVSIMISNDIKYLATFNKKDFMNIKEIELLNL